MDYSVYKNDDFYVFNLYLLHLDQDYGGSAALMEHWARRHPEWDTSQHQETTELIYMPKLNKIKEGTNLHVLLTV